MSTSRQPRRAFRLIDLVVVIACIVILLGVILPAMHKTSRVSAYTQCVNNLKELGLAVHNYASPYANALPALTSDVAEPKHGAYNGGIFFSLLPYADSIAFSQSATDKTTRPAATWSAHILSEPPGTPALQSRPLKVYQCPFDVTINKGLSANQTTPRNTRAACSYAANYQVFGIVNDLSPDGTPTPGSGNACWPKYDIGNVPDGLSNTIFFGEQLAACNNGAGSLWAYPGIGNYSDTTAYPVTPAGSGIVNTANSTNSASWAPVFANGHTKYGFTTGGGSGSIFRHNAQAPTPERIDPPYPVGMFWDAPPQQGVTQAQCDKSRLQSSHSAAVLVGLGDGSVRTISGDVSQHSW